MVVPRWETETCLKAIQKYRATMMLLVPPVALILASDPIVDKYDLSSLKYLLSGAAPLGPELQGRLRKRLGCYVTQAYGMTESSPTSHYGPYDSPRPGSCGKLLPNVQGRIVDPVTMKDVENIGDEGEIWMKGPIIMKGVSAGCCSCALPNALIFSSYFSDVSTSIGQTPRKRH